MAVDGSINAAISRGITVTAAAFYLGAASPFDKGLRSLGIFVAVSSRVFHGCKVNFSRADESNHVSFVFPLWN